MSDQFAYPSLDQLLDVTFRFYHKGQPQTAQTLRLAPDGRILDYTHSNEACWDFSDGQLRFVASDGRVSVAFQSVSANPRIVRLEGQHLFEPNTHVTLCLEDARAPATVFQRSEASAASGDEPIGFDYNDGGINNQKLALLGLILEAGERGCPIYLPRLYGKEFNDSLSTFHAFDDIFDLSLIAGFLDRWNIAVVPAPNRTYADRIERGGWNYFSKGAWHLAEARRHSTGVVVKDFFRSLRPQLLKSSFFTRLCTAIFEEQRIDIVNQLRIEADWREHCRYNLDPVLPQPEDYNIDASLILRKTRETLRPEAVLVTCDERYLPCTKAELTAQVRRERGICILWKSDFMAPADLDGLGVLERSLLDFELAKTARTFVGMSRSTFASLATFERYCSRFQDYGEDYIYNLPSERLGLRIDFGCRVDPFEVCGLRREAQRS